MKKRRAHILETLARAPTAEACQAAILALRDDLRVAHLAYHRVIPDRPRLDWGTLSDTWTRRYSARDYRRIDPVVAGCLQRFQPTDWKRLDWSSKTARAYLEDAIAHGLGTQGYSVPIRGPNGQFALMSASHSCDDRAWRAFARGNRRDLILMAHEVHRKAREFAPDPMPALVRALSPREVDAISLIARGYSRAQVAGALSISEHTLRVYIEAARTKLGALNTTHAVAQALRRGLIMI
ncbi:autoinducer binding domain-containing protein [Shimia sp.]|uniref:helix-turn-helix transcriptional regulator n=1 Tax=Shimia sp. TaxID=1954381 RepID=UPI0035665A82